MTKPLLGFSNPTKEMFATKISIVLTLLHCAVRHSDGGQDHVIGMAQFELCPKVEICEENATSAILRPNGPLEYDSISCCQGCSCHPDCKHFKNCCFPNNNINNNNNSTNADDNNNTMEPVCTHMRVGSPGRQWSAAVISYYTIWAEPTGGCVNIQPFKTGSGQIMPPSCGSQPIAKWGELFPVFSNASKAIYKNEACARCHGVSGYERFSPSLVCEKSLEGAALAADLEAYATGTLPSTCYVEFQHHDENTVLRSRRCLSNPVSTCASGTIAPLAVSMNLTLDAIATGCETGVHSPVFYRTTSKAYKNVFCLLCSEPLASPGSLFCEEDWTRRSYGPQVLTFLLDARMAKPTDPKEGGASGPIACLKEKDELLETTCRVVHCPTGRVRNSEGQCIFISPTWTVHGLAITIKLEPVGESATPYKDDPAPIIADIIKSNPWSADWLIQLAYTKRRDGLRKSGANIALTLVFTGKRFRADALLRGINILLSKPWSVEVNGSRLDFKQSLLDYDLAGILKEGALTPAWTTYVSNSNPVVSSDDAAQWILQPTKGNLLLVPSYVSRLMLCDQHIDLQPHEYQSIVSGYLIKNNLSGRLMFNLEFVLLGAETGSRVARVCLSDTPLVTKTSGSSYNSSVIVFILINVYLSLGVWME